MASTASPSNVKLGSYNDDSVVFGTTILSLKNELLELASISNLSISNTKYAQLSLEVCPVIVTLSKQMSDNPSTFKSISKSALHLYHFLVVSVPIFVTRALENFPVSTISMTFASFHEFVEYFHTS